jgi:hypothetical protein
LSKIKYIIFDEENKCNKGLLKVTQQKQKSHIIIVASRELLNYGREKYFVNTHHSHLRHVKLVNDLILQCKGALAALENARFAVIEKLHMIKHQSHSKP